MHATVAVRTELPIESLRVGAFRIPTDSPESDGTLEWNSTTLVVVEIEAGDEKGLGYTYADTPVAGMIKEHFEALLAGRDALGTPAPRPKRCSRSAPAWRRSAASRGGSREDIAAPGDDAP